MRVLVLVLLVLGTALGQFIFDTPEVLAARKAFFEEYQRRAKLAEEAPDIHIFFSDPKDLPERPATFTFSASLGAHKQVRPSPEPVPVAQELPAAQEPPQPVAEAPLR